MATDESDHAGDAGDERNPVLATLNVADRVLGWTECAIVAGCVLVMALLMSAHVVGNLIFGTGIPGTYEVTEMLIVVMTFVGVGYAARHARHISMSAIYDQLSGRARKALLVLICLGTAVLMFYFAFKSTQYVLTLYDRGRTSAALEIPYWIVNLALPIGFSLAGIQYLLTTVRNLVSDDIYRSFSEKETYSDVPPDESGETATDGKSNG